MTYAILWRWNGTTFKVQSVIDSFYSMVWTERWLDYGDVELKTGLDCPARINDFITIPERRMAVRIVQIVTERDTKKIIAKDSLALLDYRIIAGTVQATTVADFVTKMLTADSIILTAGATETARTLPMMAIGDLTPITGSARIQRSYAHIGETLISIGKAYGFNPYATMHSGKIEISAEAVSNSYNPVLADNVLSGWGIGEEETSANVCYVGGQIVDASREVAEVGTASGFGRREIFTDRRDLPAENMNYDALVEYYGVPDFTDVSGTGNARVTPRLSGTAAPYTLFDMSVMVSCYSDNTHSRIEVGICESLKSVLSPTDYEALIANVDINTPQLYTARYDGSILTVDIHGLVRVSLSPDAFLWHIEFYTEMLESIGEQTLAEQEPSALSWAEIEKLIPYSDYSLGDVLRVIWSADTVRNCRVIEIVESWDAEGYKCTPAMEFEDV